MHWSPSPSGRARSRSLAQARGSTHTIALLTLISVLAAFSAWAHAQQSTPGCLPCVGGVCYANPPGAVTSNELEVLDQRTAWRPMPDGTVCLCRINLIGRKVVLRNCSNLPFVVNQYFYVQVVELLSGPIDPNSVAGAGGPGTVPDTGLNGPSTGGPWPPTWPPASVTWNCHSQAIGLGPGTPAPLPASTPPPPSQFPGAEPVNPSGSGSGQGGPGGGYFTPDPTDVYRTNCWRDCFVYQIPPPNPPNGPPAGTVLVWYKAPIENKEPNYSNATPLHSATSNGDGTYTSKNGTEPLRDQESYGHLEQTYGKCDSPDGKGNQIYVLVKRRDC